MTLEEKRRAFITTRKPGDMKKLVDILQPTISRRTIFKYISKPYDGCKHQQVIEAAWKLLK